MPFFVYILECVDKTYYIGCTNNLNKRLKQHNRSKLGAHYTKTRRPVTLKYTERFDSRAEALRREYELKQWTKSKKKALITGVWHF